MSDHTPFTWDADAVSGPLRLGLTGYLRAGLRGGLLIGLILAGLAVLLMIRLIERPLFGPRRPVSPSVTQSVCRNALRIMGIRYRILGTPLTEPGAMVANHSSWLDIFALNAANRMTFISKSEVARWPGIGTLARATGTVFIARDRRETAPQVSMLQAQMAAGHRLLLFPEGTSTDGRRVLPFKPSLFAAFLSVTLRDSLWVQPITVIYTAPVGSDPRAYGWWGGMDLAPHLISTLAARPQGRVTVMCHPPLRVRDFSDRKALAAAAETVVRKGLEDNGIRPDEGAA